ncbi:MAG: hypothetical protein K6G71_09960 [Clostridiales bacterium]|nr:hypothetical protein [Clostridiales bacterium]
MSLSKRIFSVCLAVIMLAGLLYAAVPALADAGAVEDQRKYPTLMIRGKAASIYNYVGTEEEHIVYDSDTGRVPVPDGYIEEALKEYLPLLAKGILLNNYNEWANAVAHVLDPIYKDFRPDENGDPQYDSGTKYTLPKNDTKGANGLYDPDGCNVFCDWRLDPLVCADVIKESVDNIKRVTGAQKINISALCEGGCFLLAYLQKYGHEDIGTIIFDKTCMNGCTMASNTFAGKIHIDADMVDAFVTDSLNGDRAYSFGQGLFEDEVYYDLIKYLVTYLNDTYGLDMAVKLVNRILTKTKDIIFPGFIMDCYGTCLSYWAMVDEDDFGDAVDLLLKDPKYSVLKERAEYYHENVMLKQDEILKLCAEDGVNVHFLALYGGAMPPLFEDDVMLNDNLVTTADMSLGATTAKIGEKLSDSYIASRKAAGFGEYISADGQVDASTCLFPDTTWFVKNADHDEIYWCLNMRNYILANGGSITVKDDPTHPQFRIRLEDRTTIVPLTEENADQQLVKQPLGFFENLKALLKIIVTLIRDKLRTMFK